MPCTSEGYSNPRPMQPDEAWRSFSRHHAAMEVELEAYREWAKQATMLFPDISIHLPNIPPKTPSWSGQTYRDKNGEWPSDIRKHCDWLSKKDF